MTSVEQGFADIFGVEGFRGSRVKGLRVAYCTLNPKP